jgi:hypothetical protein
VQDTERDTESTVKKECQADSAAHARQRATHKKHVWQNMCRGRVRRQCVLCVLCVCVCVCISLSLSLSLSLALSLSLSL